ncbi:MAG: hypothetical protein [Microvirus sp.]|nr:MAG: hypothetical protein [Microvirus sp.]
MQNPTTNINKIRPVLDDSLDTYVYPKESSKHVAESNQQIKKGVTK